MLVTIAICTRNRPSLLRRLLQGIADLSIPAGVETEILICDNSGSISASLEVLGHFPALNCTRILLEPKAGKSYALIRLIREAHGDWIFFLDDDVRPARDWLSGYIDAIRRYPDAELFGGQILPEPEGRLPGLRRHVLRFAPGVCGGVTSRRDTPYSLRENMTVGGANLAFRRESLLLPPIERDLRLLAERDACCEDLVLVIGLVGRGAEGWLLAAPTVTHHVPLERAGLRWFCQWWFLRGQTCRKVPAGIPASIGLRRFVFRRRLFRLWNDLATFRIAGSLLTLLSIVALAAGFLWVPRQRQGESQPDPISGNHESGCAGGHRPE